MKLPEPRGYPRNLWRDDQEIRHTLPRWEYDKKQAAFNRKVRRITQKAVRQAAIALLLEEI